MGLSEMRLNEMQSNDELFLILMTVPFEALPTLMNICVLSRTKINTVTQ